MNIIKDALGYSILLTKDIEGILAESSDMSLERLLKRLTRMAMSHERIRAELEGCEMLMKEDAKRAATLYEFVRRARAATDNHGATCLLLREAFEWLDAQPKESLETGEQ